MIERFKSWIAENQILGVFVLFVLVTLSVVALGALIVFVFRIVPTSAIDFVFNLALDLLPDSALFYQTFYILMIICFFPVAPVVFWAGCIKTVKKWRRERGL